MSINYNLIKSAVLDFQAHKSNCSGQWLTISAWQSLLCKYYALGDGLEFNAEELNKAIKLIGAVASKISCGNTTGVISNNTPFDIHYASHSS